MLKLCAKSAQDINLKRKLNFLGRCDPLDITYLYRSTLQHLSGHRVTIHQYIKSVFCVGVAVAMRFCCLNYLNHGVSFSEAMGIRDDSMTLHKLWWILLFFHYHECVLIP